MSDRLNQARVLIYSHDTFGLGHLRRCRAIAHALVEKYKGLSVLILSGSPIIGSFDFRARVDFIRIPGVIKLHNGEYTSLGLHIELEQTLALRSSIIQHTAEIFEPDLFLVDKEPLGFNGEVVDTLHNVKSRGGTIILGLRDIMDEPSLLRREWRRKKVMPALEELYDEIWVFGLKQISDPLSGLDAPQSVHDKIIHTGYLRRKLPTRTQPGATKIDKPYVLVTTGGGGDGSMMIDWVLQAYEKDPTIPHPALVVLGPFMPPTQQEAFRVRAERLDRIEVIDFDTHLELLMEQALGVIAMGGYNTFCEILSFNKRAVLVPRFKPRREQLLRAQRAEELGLVKYIKPESKNGPRLMAKALHTLPSQNTPSDVVIPGLLDGLDCVSDRVEYYLHDVKTLPMRHHQVLSKDIAL